ncbi:MAG: hypothetical protein A2571_02780 [Candidatus Vogelbacteria bacterium RIFOXYD1_FULL_44_32]|uniref:Uncharacterized protein n=1 Tax=Candidatus Vogelbacteria bacterium RIFOXYD1_FULL_44_32 TaxID=1802438 RepID=A0A1G2QF35_9BACT|nr:MAG: hypothetical protein A2571_02780 [Candidatus Vogelbacteria bacterium RIFOXYD1_FULL_44_32]
MIHKSRALPSARAKFLYLIFIFVTISHQQRSKIDAQSGLSYNHKYMKKLQIFLALGITIPYILASLYGLYAYGNDMDPGDWDGIEIIMFLMLIAWPLIAICFLSFISRMIYLKVKQRPVWPEFICFTKSLIILGVIAIGLWNFAGYCNKNKCGFLPTREIPKNSMYDN